jgi:NADPH:quinone reductase-like Zn-dependent oxidoreductase
MLRRQPTLVPHRKVRPQNTRPSQHALGGILTEAIICTKYGPPEALQLRQLEKPTPRENEVLIKIHATAVTSGDVIDRTGVVSPWAWLPTRLVFGLTKPRREMPGADLAGEIEAVGRNVR